MQYRFYLKSMASERSVFIFFEKCIHQRLLLVLCYSSLRSKSDPIRNSETEKNYPTLNLTYFQLPSRIRTQAKSMEYEGEKKLLIRASFQKNDGPFCGLLVWLALPLSMRVRLVWVGRCQLNRFRGENSPMLYWGEGKWVLWETVPRHVVSRSTQRSGVLVKPAPPRGSSSLQSVSETGDLFLHCHMTKNDFLTCFSYFCLRSSLLLFPS